MQSCPRKIAETPENPELFKCSTFKIMENALNTQYMFS
jgi:hypothetical protein